MKSIPDVSTAEGRGPQIARGLLILSARLDPVAESGPYQQEGSKGADYEEPEHRYADAVKLQTGHDGFEARRNRIGDRF